MPQTTRITAGQNKDDKKVGESFFMGFKFTKTLLTEKFGDNRRKRFLKTN
jgi:hypothetical protein